MNHSLNVCFTIMYPSAIPPNRTILLKSRAVNGKKKSSIIYLTFISKKIICKMCMDIGTLQNIGHSKVRVDLNECALLTSHYVYFAYANPKRSFVYMRTYIVDIFYSLSLCVFDGEPVSHAYL